jgi:hypothetical protein
MTVQTLQAKALPEYALKTAYLYNFALLTKWSVNDNKSDTFNICFYKEDFGTASDVLKEKTIHDKKINIFSIDTVEDTKECQMVYIRDKELIEEAQLFELLSKAHILVVTDNEEIKNTHITIFSDSTKLAFNINLKSLKNTDLTVSSHLLKLAKKVIK